MKERKQTGILVETGKSLAVGCLLTLTLQGCSPRYPDASNQKDGTGTDKNSKTSATTSPAETSSSGDKQDAESAKRTLDNKSDLTKESTQTKESKTQATLKATEENSSQIKKDDKNPLSLLNDLPEITAASKKVDLRKMPDTDVICTVQGIPVTVGQYKDQFKLRETKIQALLSANHELLEQLLAEAKKRKISLTEEEKKRFLETSHRAEAATGDVLTKYLKDNKISKADFDDHVLSIGLALKTSADITKETLLNEIVDQTLLVQAAKDKGLYTKAFNKYIEAKAAPGYKDFLAQNGLNQAQAQSYFIDQTLINMFIQQLKDNNSKVSDKEIQTFYDENKDKLKHGERFKLSQIVIAAPTDSAGQPGIKEQLKAKFPKLSQKELDLKTEKYRADQKERAEGILDKLKHGANFAKLADSSTDDPANESLKNGGDIGWKEKAALDPDFSAKVETLKAGEFYPHILTTRFGYHIIKLDAKDPPGITPLSEVKELIKEQLVQQKQVKAVVDWITTNHKANTIKLSPDFSKLVAAGK